MPRESPPAGQWWRAPLSEALATCLLVSLGVGTTLPYEGSRPLTDPALGFGAVVAALVVAFGPASGAHMNPAITLAAALLGHIGWRAAAVYCGAQLVGAACGAGLLAGAWPAGWPGLGVTRPGAGVSAMGACLLEALQTGALVLVVCTVWRYHDASSPDHTAALKIGVTVTALVYAFGPLTGTAINPARSFGPALVSNEWTHLWLYVVGPLLGAAAAAAASRYVLHPRDVKPPAPPPDPALVPLNKLPAHDAEAADA